MIDEYEEMAVVSTIILHNFWSGSPARGFDFALLQLPLNSSQQPVKLISDDAVLVEEEPLAIAGWGRVQGSGPFALTLQEADELPFISPERCEPTDIGSAAQDLLCVGVGKAGSCAGDQGGPLIRKNSLDPQNSTLDELVGIVTSIPSASCAQLGLPSVCTGIQKVSTFIELNIKDLER
ncbi:unnamed protein product [Ostreobium quekettii]|uniref:Peptidase S1 domain-containing protein n=1 Tax=Ostreobium quekettii TaxID=121088 RepID=A0A8S1INN3_9CHLO|nr:unnamed protein product [Ostreobium quekettii]